MMRVRRTRPLEDHSAIEQKLISEAAPFAGATVTTALAEEVATGAYRNLLMIVEFQHRVITDTTFRFLISPPRSLPSQAHRFIASELHVPASLAVDMLRSRMGAATSLSHLVGPGTTKDIEVPGEWTPMDCLTDGHPETIKLRRALPHHDGLIRLLRLVPTSGSSLPEADQAAGLELLTDVTGVDLDPSFLGGIAVVMPDRGVRARVLPAASSGVLGLELLLDEPCGPATVVVRGTRGKRPVATAMKVVEAGLHVLKLETACDSYHIDVFDRSGRLRWSEHVQPLRSVTIGGLVKTGGIALRTGGARKPLEVDFGFETDITISDVPRWEEAERTGRLRQARIELLAKGGVAVFSGSPADRARAVEYLRTQMQSARARVWLLDPYLDGSDVLNFLPDSFFGRVEIRALSCGKDRQSMRDRLTG